MPNKETRDRGAFPGVRRLLTHFHLQYRDFPSEVQTLAEAVEILNEETELILIPVTLEEGWYRTAAGPFLVQDTAGVDYAVLPDWRGWYYFIDEGTGRRVYLNRKNSHQFCLQAYAVARDFPCEKISSWALLHRMLGGMSRLEGLLLLLWAVLRGELWIWMARMVHQALSNGGLAAGKSAFWQIAALIVGIVLAEALLCFSGGRMIRRAAQKGALSAMPGIGERLYASDQLDDAAPTAFRLSAARENGQRWGDWFWSTVWNLMSAMVIAAALAGSMSAAWAAAGGIALALYAASAAVCLWMARQTPGISVGAARRQWFLRRTVERRLGIERAFPWGEEKRLRVLPWVGCSVAALLTLPLLSFALSRGTSMARLAQTLLLYLPVTGLPLAALLGASGAGRALSELLALLPAAECCPKGDVALPPPGSSFELKDVAFSYDGQEKPVLCGVNLRLHPGEVVGILGKTGAGKTTLARLMTGMEKPTGGNIYYGGVELGRYNGASIHRRIAYHRGTDILLADQVPPQRDGRTCVVFATRPQALLSCDRVLRLVDGVLVEQ